MKPQPAPRLSVSRSLTAMMLMAASSLSLGHAEDISGSAHGPILDMTEGLFSSPIPESEYRRGGVAKMTITQSGSVSLAVEFSSRVHRQTGIFIEDVGAPEPTYVADFGTTTGGYGLKAYLYANVGDVGLLWRTPEGADFHYAYLSKGVTTNAYPDFTSPKPYNTVNLNAVLHSPDLSGPDMPTGAGYGILMTRPSGSCLFAGTLPDGQTVTGGGQLAFGSYIYHVPMMLRTRSRRDTLCGYMPAVNDMSVPSDLQWVKGASPSDTLLPSGGRGHVFAETFPYTPPASGERIFLTASDKPLNMEFLMMAADRGQIPGSAPHLTTLFTMTDYNQAVFPAPNTEKYEIKFLPALGFFTGKMKLPYPPPMQPKMVKFSGVLRQTEYVNEETGDVFRSAGEGRGFYLAAPLPGTVTVPGPKVSGLVQFYPRY